MWTWLVALTLVSAVRGGGERRTKYGCEGSSLELECEEGAVISLVRANYGRFSLSICNSLAEGSLSTQCDSSRETSSILRSRCSGLSSCSVLVTPALFPAVPSCSHTPLYLEVQYECEAGARAGGGQQQPRAGTNMGANISRVWEHGDTGLNPALVERAVRGEIEGSRGQPVPVTEDSEVEDSEDTVTTSLNSPRLATSGQGHRLEMLPDSGDTGADSDGEYDDDIGDSAGAGDSGDGGDGGDGVFSYREVLIISLSSSLLVTLALVTAALSCLHSSRRKLGAGSGPGHGVPDLIPMSGSASAATSAATSASTVTSVAIDTLNAATAAHTESPHCAPAPRVSSMPSRKTVALKSPHAMPPSSTDVATARTRDAPQRWRRLRVDLPRAARANSAAIRRCRRRRQ